MLLGSIPKLFRRRHTYSWSPQGVNGLRKFRTTVLTTLRGHEETVGTTLGAALLLIGFAGCKKKATEAAAVQSGNPNAVAVTSALAENLKFGTPELTEVSGTLQVAAHVETDARRIAHVGSPVSGRILKLLVFEGQQVKSGTVLAMLHSTDLSDTQSSYIWQNPILDTHTIVPVAASQCQNPAE